MKEKQSIQNEYGRILEEIDRAEAEVQGDSQAQLMKLTLANTSLREQLGKAEADRTEMLQAVLGLAEGVELLRQSGEKGWHSALDNIGTVLSEAHQRHEEQRRDPLSFLKSQTSSDG